MRPDAKVRRLRVGLCIIMRSVMVLVGIALLLWGAQWAAMAFGLSIVRPTMPVTAHLSDRLREGDGVFTFVWWRSTLEAAAGFALIPNWRPKYRFDVASVAIAVFAACCMAFLIQVFAGSREYGTCVYPGCWPGLWDGAVLAAPFFAGLLTLAVMASFADRIPLWVRCLCPTAVYLVGMVLLAATWDRWLLPFFAGPPPW